MTGFIIVNKKEGVSSAAEVARIKRLTHTPCGHMGTLDPMASGVLPVAIGNAARLFDYFLQKRKTYIATFRFGLDSDTLDTTGTVINEGKSVPAAAEIQKILPEFLGEIDQIPPKYSAKSVNGRRGYQLARAGVEFELPAKKVTIYSIKLLGAEGADGYKFEIECGGGTYIRSIARDMGAKLDTCAVMSALVRTKSGPFAIEKSVQTDELTEENIANFIIPTDSVLDFESIHPDELSAKKLFNGLSIDSDLNDGLYKIYGFNGGFYGLAEVKNQKLKVRTKLC